MINAPIFEIECDHCHDLIEIEPEYKYSDMSGDKGYFDCSNDAIMGLLRDKGWLCTDDDQICNDCAKIDDDED